MSSTFKVPKHQSPMNKSINSNNNVTTTKGIAKDLISKTSPQSDSENRPLGNSISKYVHMNGSAKNSNNSSISPSAAAQFKQSTLSFNGTKSKPTLKVNEFVSALRGHDSDSEGDSSDDEVLLVSQQKSKESKPLKTAKVANLQNLKSTSSDGNVISHSPTPKKKEGLSKAGGTNNGSATKIKSHATSPNANSSINGKDTGSQGEKVKLKKKISKVKEDVTPAAKTNAAPSKQKKPKLSSVSNENGEKSAQKVKSSSNFSSALQKNVISFSISSDEDEPLCKISKVKSSETGEDKTPAPKTPSNSVSKPVKKEKAPVKKEKGPDDESDENEDVPLSMIKQKTLKIKHLKTKPFSPTKANKGKNLGQLQKQFSTTTSDKGKVKVEYQQPVLVLKLMRVLEDEKWHEDPDKTKRMKSLVSHIAKNLSAFQRERVPASIRDIVAKKHVELQEKERWKNLTPEQKKSEIDAKRLERQRQLQLAKAAAIPVEKPKLVKQDDLLHENVKPLPKPTQIKLLEGITMQMYGDILMIIELLQVFKGILSADDCYELDFTVDFLMEALTRGNDGFLFLSSIVEALLKTLLQDQVNELMSELDTDLSKITVTCHSASDLCRIYLNQVANDSERADDFNDNASLVEAREQLISKDFVDLPPTLKLEVILFLCQEILRSSTYEDYVQEKQALFSDCFKYRLKAKQDYEKFMKDKADREADLAAKKAEIIAKASEKSYGEQSSETASTLIDAGSEMDADKFLTVAEEHAILTSSMSRRQQEMELAKLRKDREERFKRIKTEQEIEENKVIVEKEKREAEYEKLSLIVHKLLRLSPIGNDRYHNRYWILDSVPGILVEKCWADSCISYEPPPLPKLKEHKLPSPVVRTSNSPVKDPPLGAASNSENLQNQPDSVNPPEMKLITTLNGDVVRVAQEAPEIQVIGDFSNIEDPSKDPLKEDIPAKLLPRVGQNSWVVYNTVEQIELLMKRLNEWGNRECALKAELRKHKESLFKKLKSIKPGPAPTSPDKIKTSPLSSPGKENAGDLVEHRSETATPSKTEPDLDVKVEVVTDMKVEQPEVVDVEDDEDDPEKLPILPKKFKDHYLNYLQSDMKDLHLRLFNGGLSCGDSETVENKIDATKTMEDMKKCIITIYDCVFPKFFTGVLRPDYYQMAAADKKPRSEWCVLSPHESADENDDGTAKLEAYLSWCETKKEQVLPEGAKKWQLEVINASTWSRLHVLLGVLDSCVRWEKSVAKSGCTVCRKKKDEDQTLLCDECNRAYHIYCLRPILKEIPAGDWLCPNCKPKENRRAASSKASLSDQEDEKSNTASKDQANSEEYCFCCLDGGDELIMCNTCPRVYHLHCHQPPLRRVPRGNWNCMVCLNPRLKRKKGFLFSDSQDDRRSRNSYYSDESDSESHSRTTRSGTRSSSRRTRANHDSDSDEDQPRRSARSTKGTRSDDLYRNTLDRNRRNRAAIDTDGSTSDDESHSAAARRSARTRSKKYVESSDEESDQQKSGDSQSHPTSREASPDRDSNRTRGSKRKNDHADSSSDGESSQSKSKKMKNSTDSAKETEKGKDKDANGEKYEVLEVAEEVDICEKIFYDIKSKNTFMFFENIAEVEAYSQVGNKVDFSTITVMMEEPGYIWKGFIRDLAYIVNNAISVFEETHRVHRAAIKLDERMRILMRNLPIMLKRYDQIRQGMSEEEIQDETPEGDEQEEENEEYQETSSTGDKHSSHNGPDSNRATTTSHTAATVIKSEEPSRNGDTSTISTLRDEQHLDESLGGPTHSLDSTSTEMTSSTNSNSSAVKKRWWLDEDLVAKRMERYRLNREERYCDITFEERKKREIYVNEYFKMVDVNQENDICAKILYRLKLQQSLCYFMNVSDVAAYAKIKSKVDFVKIESKMDKKGYLWQGFMTDLAIIVNNSLIAFPRKTIVHKAGLRLDRKVRQMLVKFPHMIELFDKVRSEVAGFLDDNEEEDEEEVAPVANPSGKKRGRPRKYPLKEENNEDSQPATMADASEKLKDEDKDEAVVQPEADGEDSSEVIPGGEKSCDSTTKNGSIDLSDNQKSSNQNPVLGEGDEGAPKQTSDSPPVVDKTSCPGSTIEPPKTTSTNAQNEDSVKTPEDGQNQGAENVKPIVEKENESAAAEKSQLDEHFSEENTPDTVNADAKKDTLSKEAVKKNKIDSNDSTVESRKPSPEKEKSSAPTSKPAETSSKSNSPPSNSKSASPAKQPAQKREVKMSEISFFGDDEGDECFALCKKIFRELREKQSFACFNNIHSLKALQNLDSKVDLDYIAKEIHSDSYSWNKFLSDVAEIVNNTLSLLPAESSPHKAALKLDLKMLSSLKSFSSMKKLYESLRLNPAPPKLKFTSESSLHYQCSAKSSPEKMVKKSECANRTHQKQASPKKETAKAESPGKNISLNKTDSPPKKETSKTEASKKESPGKDKAKSEANKEKLVDAVSSQDTTTLGDKLMSTRTLEKNEIETLCMNIFDEIKKDEELICLKYLTKDPVCHKFEKRIDLSKIEKKLTKPGYIWGKFIRDLAIVAKMGEFFYPKDSCVTKGYKALDKKVETSLRRFPVMYKKYVKVRHESLMDGTDNQGVPAKTTEKEVNGTQSQQEQGNNLFNLIENTDNVSSNTQVPNRITSSTPKKERKQSTSSKTVQHTDDLGKVNKVTSKSPLKAPDKSTQRSSSTAGSSKGVFDTLQPKTGESKNPERTVVSPNDTSDTSKTCPNVLKPIKKAVEDSNEASKTLKSSSGVSKLCEKTSDNSKVPSNISNSITVISKVKNTTDEVKKVSQNGEAKVQTSVSEQEASTAVDFLKELRANDKLSCFEDLSKNPPETTSGGATWKEKPMDFATIAVKLKSSTSYGLDQMVLDLALIVNNALAMDATFSCAGRLLDVKLLTLLQMYPSLRQRYKTYRSEKRSSSISETNDASISNQTSPCVNSLPPNPKSLSKKPASEESPKFAEHSSSRKKLKTSSETTAKEEHSPSVEVAKPAKIKQKLDIDKHKTSSSKSDEAQKTASSSDSTNGAKTPNELTKTSMTKENQNASSVVTFLNPPPVNSSSNSATVSKPSSASSSVSQFVQKVEVDEVVDICHKILRDIQSKTNYQVFQNVTEVPSYSVVKKRVDLMTIQSLMNNDGYIWEKFIEDMALIVNNAVVAFEPSHTVHKAALKLDSRMLTLMQRLPIMRGHYENIRANYQEVLRKRLTETEVEAPESEKFPDIPPSPECSPRKKVKKEPTSSTSESSTSNNSQFKTLTPTKSPNIVLERLTPEKVAKTLGGRFDHCEVAPKMDKSSLLSDEKPTNSKDSNSSTKSENSATLCKSFDGAEKISEKSEKECKMETRDQSSEGILPILDLVKNPESSDNTSNIQTTNKASLPVLPKTLPTNEAVSSSDSSKSKPDKNEGNSAIQEVSSDVQMQSNTAEASKCSTADSSSVSSAAPSSKSSRVSVFEQKEEIDEEVDICEKIFLDIRTKTHFIFFENISCVAAYSDVVNKVDFSSIEKQLHEPGYIWANFIRDMARIVNNAQQVFEPTHKAHKAASRLDDRMKHLMRRLPIMMSHYVQTRAEAGMWIAQS